MIRDDRETPTAALSANVDQQTKNYSKAKRSSSKQHQKGSFVVALQSRIRRGRLSRLYEHGQVDKNSVFLASFGGDPRKVVAEGKRPVLPSQAARPDPLCPEGSFPDRMVECVLIHDERTKYVASTSESDSDDDCDLKMVTVDSVSQGGQDPTKSPYGIRLFLRRRTLTEPYVASATVHACEDCGGMFGSKVGYSYHTRSEVCITKAKKMAAATRKFLETVEEKATQALNKRHRPERKKSRKNIPVYPQVWLSLGVKFVVQKPPTKPDLAMRRAEEAAAKVEPLDDVLRRLKNQLRRDRDRSLGTIYPGVYESLNFRRPSPRWKIIEEEEKERKRKEVEAKRRMMRELERQKKPPPPIVDIQVLADEVDAGRYPSMKRYSGGHEDVCTICKDGGDLLCCDFCKRTTHLHCIRKKHTIKDPEPQDDFMCHLCIQNIMARRNRAEKRRIKKQKTALKQSPSAELAIGSGGESAYHDVAALGHELRDLTELIRDAKCRLRQAIGVSKLNETRRSMLGL